MKSFRVLGIHSKSEMDLDLRIDARTAENAKLKAMLRGIVISSIEELPNTHLTSPPQAPSATRVTSRGDREHAVPWWKFQSLSQLGFRIRAISVLLVLLATGLTMIATPQPWGNGPALSGAVTGILVVYLVLPIIPSYVVWRLFRRSQVMADFAFAGGLASVFAMIMAGEIARSDERADLMQPASYQQMQVPYGLDSLTSSEEGRRETDARDELQTFQTLWQRQGSVEAMAWLTKHAERHGIERWRRAADQGDPSADYLLAVCYAHGVVVEQSDAKSFYLCRRAAAAGLVSAMSSVAMKYYWGSAVVPQDYGQAFTWYRRAAQAGDTAAMWSLGTMYADGRGVSQNDAQAVWWLRQAAAAGHAGAMNSLGAMYSTGRGVSRDGTEATFWYRRAAEEGSASAMEELGRRYLYGFGLTRDVTKARQWFDRAKVARKAEVRRWQGGAAD